MATTTSVLGLTKPAYSEAADVSVLNSDMDLIDAEAGRVRGNIAANYSASSAYAVGDLCLYTGVLYRCKTAIGSGGEAWNSGHWDAVKIAGQLSALSDQIANKASLVSLGAVSAGTSKNYTLTNYSAVLVVAFGQDVFGEWMVIVGNGTTKTFEINSTSNISLASNANNKVTISITGQYYGASIFAIPATGAISADA